MYSTHNHFESLYDTANNIKAMLLEYINAGFKRVAVTDHGEATSYEALLKTLNKLQSDEKDKQKENPEYIPDEKIMNFEIVFGVEGYLKDNINPKENSHIILISEDYEGYQSLCKVITESNRNKNMSSGQPIITLENLKKNISKDHVYCTSACIGGPFGHLFGLDEMRILEHINQPNKKDNITTLTEELDRLNIQKESEEEIANQLLNQFFDIFGKKHFFFEIQNHYIDKEKIIYNKIIRFALKYHPQFVAANDVHIGVTKNSPNLELAIKARNVSKSRRFKKYQEDTLDDLEYYIKSDEELKEALLQLQDDAPYLYNNKEIPLETIVDKAIKNTCFLENCNITFPKTTHYPKFNQSWTKEETKEYFISQIEKGKHELFPDGFPSKEYEERLQHEIDVISSMGYIDYHLIVQEYNQYGKTLGDYTVGPGRGSAAGSLVCYCLGITEIDPIKYNLLFERFLNIERISMPDIDMDFSNEIREKVIDHVSERYGEDKTCRIVTQSYSKAKGSLREIARYLGRIDAYNEGVTPDSKRGKELTKPYYEIADRLCKQIGSLTNLKDEQLFDEIETTYIDPEEVEDDSKTQAEILEEDTTLDEIENALDEDAMALKITKLARGINGLFMGYGMHACGGIISSDPIDSIIPLRMSDTGALETSCAYPQAEDRGLLKMDFLGLMTLDIINDCIKRTGDKTLCNIITSNKAIEDKRIYQNIFDKGLTSAIFQFASPGMIKMLKEFKPDCFEDVILLVAAYRPGPMDYLPNIIAIKQYRDGRSKTEPTPTIDIDCKELQEIVNPTYGAIIYQEQVMQIFCNLAGYTLGQADIPRRAMGKKHLEELIPERKAFIFGDESRNIEGCIKKVGMSEADGNKLFDQMTEFAKYAFNKSHAAAYAKLSAFTAYLLDRHPQEYITSYLNFTSKESNRIRLLKEASDHGIKILPPAIDHGFTKFEPVGTDKVRFGSGFIKGMSFDDVAYPDNVEDLFLQGHSEAKIKSIVNMGLVKELWHDEDLRIYNGRIDNHFLSVFNELVPVYTNLLKKKAKIEEYEQALTDSGLTERQKKQKNTNLTKNRTEYQKYLLQLEELKRTAFEHEVLPITDEEIITRRTAEYESIGCAFEDIDRAINELNATPDIDPKLFSLTENKVINVCATVVSVSEIKTTKKGNQYRSVSLMLKDGRIIERRFEDYPTKITGQFKVYSEAGKFFTTSGIAYPLPAVHEKAKINCLFGVNNGIIIHFSNCKEENIRATKVINNLQLIPNSDVNSMVNVNEHITLINAVPDNSWNTTKWMIQVARKYPEKPVIVPYSSELYRKVQDNPFLMNFSNLFFVDVKTGKFYDMNMNERQDILIVKEDFNAFQR